MNPTWKWRTADYDPLEYPWRHFIDEIELASDESPAQLAPDDYEFATRIHKANSLTEMWVIQRQWREYLKETNAEMERNLGIMGESSPRDGRQLEIQFPNEYDPDAW